MRKGLNQGGSSSKDGEILKRKNPIGFVHGLATSVRYKKMMSPRLLTSVINICPVKMNNMDNGYLKIENKNNEFNLGQSQLEVPMPNEWCDK